METLLSIINALVVSVNFANPVDTGRVFHCTLQKAPVTAGQTWVQSGCQKGVLGGDWKVSNVKLRIDPKKKTVFVLTFLVADSGLTVPDLHLAYPNASPTPPAPDASGSPGYWTIQIGRTRVAYGFARNSETITSIVIAAD